MTNICKRQNNVSLCIFLSLSKTNHLTKCLNGLEFLTDSTNFMFKGDETEPLGLSHPDPIPTLTHKIVSTVKAFYSQFQ